MFTGIIEEIGAVSAVRASGGKRYFTVDCHTVLTGLKLGDSVACNGACLTATEITSSSLTVEAMAETLRKTTAGDWARGKRLHLERAMSASGRFDGHIVQGHVDKVSRLLRTRRDGETLYLAIELPREHAALVVPQGSVAVNGVSLTVATLAADSFEVAIIGHTLANTTLGELRASDGVNIEYDILGKYVLRQVQTRQSKLSEEFLREHGF